ncbi:hypothetical protein BWZ20_11290 [Winogradskyella sp. J14-2]|uniref:T9SS type A sorting domain-containing protein n=1 Tax=Winogradskyella sp. J14-2 TaxID=1936080 RepID=UPI0009727DDA|nr:T9SS type A sorting domain-containing protein [Winogradskyella sp. J14-2]APY08848.1 hypothetical protein BWZ20_11290 [Winogradskyella sp. J14-2]
MKKIYPTYYFLLFSIISFSQTFDWESATDTGNGISQTVSGITATFTSSYSSDDSKLINGNGFAGSSGNVVYTYQTDSGESATVSFSSPVDITSVYALAPYTFSGTRTYTFTPSGGSNSSVNQDLTYGMGSTVTLNWTNVSSFTITSSIGDDSFGLDDIVFTTPTLSINDFNDENTTIYPIPSSDFIYIQEALDIKSYSIYNNLGVKIMSATISSDHSIDIQNLNNGIYFLMFDNGKTSKFIKA